MSKRCHRFRRTGTLPDSRACDPPWTLSPEFMKLLEEQVFDEPISAEAFRWMLRPENYGDAEISSFYDCAREYDQDSKQPCLGKDREYDQDPLTLENDSEGFPGDLSLSRLAWERVEGEHA